MFKTLFRKFKTLHPGGLKGKFFEPIGVVLNILNIVFDNLKIFTLQRGKNVYCAKLSAYRFINSAYRQKKLHIINFNEKKTGFRHRKSVFPYFYYI